MDTAADRLLKASYDPDIEAVVFYGAPAGPAGAAGVEMAAGVSLLVDVADPDGIIDVVVELVDGRPLPGAAEVVTLVLGPEAARALDERSGPRQVAPDPATGTTRRRLGRLATLAPLARAHTRCSTSPLWSAAAATLAQQADTALGLGPAAVEHALSAAEDLADLDVDGLSAPLRRRIGGLSAVVAHLIGPDHPASAVLLARRDEVSGSAATGLDDETVDARWGLLVDSATNLDPRRQLGFVIDEPVGAAVYGATLGASAITSDDDVKSGDDGDGQLRRLLAPLGMGLPAATLRPGSELAAQHRGGVVIVGAEASDEAAVARCCKLWVRAVRLSNNRIVAAARLSRPNPAQATELRGVLYVEPGFDLDAHWLEVTAKLSAEPASQLQRRMQSAVRLALNALEHERGGRSRAASLAWGNCAYLYRQLGDTDRHQLAEALASRGANQDRAPDLPAPRAPEDAERYTAERAQGSDPEGV